MNRSSANRVLAAVVSAVLLHACAGGGGEGMGASVTVEPISTGMTASTSPPAGPQSLSGACTSGLANVALHAGVTLNGGAFFSSGWGQGWVVDASTIVDGVFLPRFNQWDQGPVWWDSRDGVDRSITLDLGGVYSIESFVVQADDNDAYLLYYHDVDTNTWHMAWKVPNYDVYPDSSSWGMQTRPDPGNNETRYALPQPIVTDALMIKGDMQSGDGYFSLSEIQAFGCPASVPGGDSPSGGISSGEGSGVGLSAYGTATIDGRMGPGEWDKAARVDFQAYLPSNDGGGTTPATLYVMNDKTDLYVAVKIARSSFGGATNPVLEFDNDNDGAREDGDDGFGMSVGIYQSPEFYDIYRYSCPGSPANSAGCSAPDSETTRGILPSGASNGATAATNDGTYTIIEMSHPLSSGDTLHDFFLKAGDTIGFRLNVRLFSLIPACNYGPACYADTGLPAANAGSNYGRITVASSAGPQPMQLGIDIAPGDPINGINPGNEGTVPVAVLSSIGFDALDRIDTSSLTFGRTGDEQSLLLCNESPEDVNGDGYPDLVCHFDTLLTGFLPGDTTGYLKGKTTDGVSFSGSDLVRVVQ